VAARINGVSMMSKSIDDGRVENPASRVDLAGGACQQGAASRQFVNPDDVGVSPATSVSTGEGFRRVSAATAEVIQHGVDGGRSSNLNPDVVSSVSASDSIGLVRDVANATNGVGRSAEDSWRVAVHEAGHVIVHRVFSNVVSVTIVPDGECSGKTWWPEGVDAAAVYADGAISDPGVSRDGDVHGVFSIVQQGVIAMMGGCAAEMTLLGDAPPKYIGSDVPNASRIAGVVCRTTASIAAFVEQGYQESLAIIEKHQTIVHALARALIDHPKHTLDGAEIDAVIVPALAAKAAADKRGRRADWAKVLENAANFTAENGMI
jgi:hypothetical protein